MLIARRRGLSTPDEPARNEDDPRQGGRRGPSDGSAPGGRAEPIRPQPDLRTVAPSWRARSHSWPRLRRPTGPLGPARRSMLAVVHGSSSPELPAPATNTAEAGYLTHTSGDAATVPAG